MRRLGVVSALSVLLWGGGVSAAAAAAPGETAGTVSRVVDGDTVHVTDGRGSRIKVRVLGIDTPETVDRRKPVQCWGPEATRFATTTLLHKKVTLVTDPTRPHGTATTGCWSTCTCPTDPTTPYSPRGPGLPAPTSSTTSPWPSTQRSPPPRHRPASRIAAYGEPAPHDREPRGPRRPPGRLAADPSIKHTECGPAADVAVMVWPRCDGCRVGKAMHSLVNARPTAEPATVRPPAAVQRPCGMAVIDDSPR
jgi:hypothetical protein